MEWSLIYSNPMIIIAKIIENEISHYNIEGLSPTFNFRVKDEEVR